MGKKSKKGPAAGGDGKSRCCSCKVYLKKSSNGEVCPGCDKLYCDACASFGSRKNVGFIACNGEECPHPPRCFDCAFGKTLGSVSAENSARRRRGEEPVIAEKPGKCDHPVSMCGHCCKTLCFPCHTWSTKGVMGHYFCFECIKTRCHECCFESHDPKHFIMHCDGCGGTSTCLDCDPMKTWDMDGVCEYYCGKCSADPEIVGGKELMLASTAITVFGKLGHLIEKKCEEKKED